MNAIIDIVDILPSLMFIVAAFSIVFEVSRLCLFCVIEFMLPVALYATSWIYPDFFMGKGFLLGLVMLLACNVLLPIALSKGNLLGRIALAVGVNLAITFVTSCSEMVIRLASGLTEGAYGSEYYTSVLQEPTLWLASVIAGCFAYGMLSIVLLRFSRHFDRFAVGKPNATALAFLLLPCQLLAALAGLAIPGVNFLSDLMIYIFALAAISLVLHFTLREAATAHAEQEELLLKQAVAEARANAEQLTVTVESIMRFRHDFRNHLQVVLGLAQRGEFALAEERISALDDDLRHLAESEMQR